MVTANERLIVEKVHQAGPLRKRVEQDMSDVLNEFGSTAAEDKREARVYSFGYGIPMAGVRYYSFSPEN